MSKPRAAAKHLAPSAGTRLTTAIAAAATFGAGAYFYAAPVRTTSAESIAPAKPLVIAEVQLVAFGYECTANDPPNCSNNPTPLPLLSAAYNVSLRPMFGDGGWLIGNGLNAAADCTGDACNGGDGGLLMGSGGNGANGGRGGNAGFSSATAVWAAQASTPPMTRSPTKW